MASETKYLLTGTQRFLGGASVDVRLVDSQTGKFLGAGIDHLAGVKKLTKVFGYWADVETIMDNRAVKIRSGRCL